MNFMVRVGSLGTLAIFGVLAACGGDNQKPASQSPSQAGAPAAAAAADRAEAGKGAASPESSDVATSRGTAGAKSLTETAGAWCGVKQTLEANCITCHNEQKTAGAPMSLKTYDDVMASAVSDSTKKVYELIGVRVHDAKRPMPPQKKLTAAELSGIDAWIAAGAPAGSDPTCANSATAEKPKMPEATWPTDCDATYKLLAHGDGGTSEPFTVPAGQEIHPKVTIPAPWGNNAMQAIAFRSITDNPRVLHHWILYGPQREFLTGWAPGKQEIDGMGSSDIGMNLAGGTLTLDMHYNNLQGTKDEPDNSGVEICVLKPEHFRKNTAAVFMGFTSLSLSIPPHSMNVEQTAQCTFTGTMPVTLLSASPHAHTMARHMKFTVKKASGETIVLHEGAFDFNEQQNYPLEKPVELAMGDVVTTTCTYDNDTDRTVTFGENTGNEMCFNFASYYPMGAMKCGGFGGFSF